MVSSLKEAEKFFLNNSSGEILCTKNGKEKACGIYSEAKSFFEEDENSEKEIRTSYDLTDNECLIINKALIKAKERVRPGCIPDALDRRSIEEFDAIITRLEKF